MKKFYILIILTIITNCLSAQQNFSSNYFEHKLNRNHQLNLLEKYNPFEIKSDFWVQADMLSQIWTDDNWLNMAYTQFFYNSNGQLTNDLNHGWEDNTWIINTRTTYTYENNLQAVMITENWENDTWVPYMKSQWTYNENGRVTSILDQNSVNNEWVNSSQTTYTYSDNNCTELLMQDWVNETWETTHRTTYEYDGEGNNIVSISETFIMGISIKSKTINTFENGLKVTELNQSLEGTEWVDVSKSTYSYNESRQQTQFVSEQWTGAEWMYTINGLYTYDGNGNNTEILTQIWQNDAWVNFMKVTINYQQTTDVEEAAISNQPISFRLFQNYPNPFNPSTKIKYSIPYVGTHRAVFVQLKVYDILGNEVAVLVNEEKPAGEYQAEFNAANLPSGLYLYRLQSGNYSETKKMLMLK
jgi:hypothetical protein